jgi:predicted transcriptional regulator
MPRDGGTVPDNVSEEMRIRAIEAGMGVLEVAKLLGLHRRSVSRWLTDWRH